MKSKKRVKQLWVGLLLWLVCVFLIFCFLGCAKHKSPSPYNTSSREFYLRSQRGLANGEYGQAYKSYQKAVAADPRIADVNHLSSILYAWAISQGEAEDRPLLDAQRRVWLEPQQLALRRSLLSVAVDREKGVIYAFGLGTAPENTPNPAQRRLLARKAALADSLAWIARLAKWAEAGVECPFEVTQTVAGVEELKEYWFGETIYVVEVRAPIDCLG